ncbi:hypothetical protein MHK_004891, partial [Candidatus Magnetomorum sp. HK-1]
MMITPNQEPLISVIRIRHNGIIEPKDTFFYKSLNKSIYKNFETILN